jgi:hypothetical protein
MLLVHEDASVAGWLIGQKTALKREKTGEPLIQVITSV